MLSGLFSLYSHSTAAKKTKGELRLFYVHQNLTNSLGLTKMNWNSIRFDGKCPVTLLCSRKVGEIMKYLPEDFEPKPDVISYGYYM